jgi:ADP-dependent phosphofructokinase/glucokinase
MNPEQWQELYRTTKKPRLKDTVTGFSMNLDRIIPVTRDLLGSARFCHPDLTELRSRLIGSMRYSTAEEWFVADPDQYRRFSHHFTRSGSLAIGGQAGIAALHLSRLGVNRVVCAAPSHGRRSAVLLKNKGIVIPEFNAVPDTAVDTEHLVFEYAPGLVSPAKGVTPRNNRFIVSPVHKPSSVLVPEECMDRFLSACAPCQRAFLSGYQYLRSGTDFAVAADQIRRIRDQNPAMRIHIEWVSVMDEEILDGCIRYVLPCSDSLGLNEHELQILLRHLRCGALHHGPTGTEVLTPLQVVQGAVDLSAFLNIRRLHVHTFGYYILVLADRTGGAEQSRNALLYAAREVASAAGGTGAGISQEGVNAVHAVGVAFGTPSSPGIFPTGSRTLIIIPTLIAREISRTSGLGDILSSTAFVGDEF